MEQSKSMFAWENMQHESIRPDTKPQQSSVHVLWCEHYKNSFLGIFSIEEIISYIIVTCPTLYYMVQHAAYKTRVDVAL